MKRASAVALRAMADFAGLARFANRAFYIASAKSPLHAPAKTQTASEERLASYPTLAQIQAAADGWPGNPKLFAGYPEEELAQLEIGASGNPIFSYDQLKLAPFIAALAKRNIHLDKALGFGAMTGVFSLKNVEGKEIPGVVARIQISQGAVKPDPFILQPIFTLEPEGDMDSGLHVMIVPRAYPLPNPEQAPDAIPRTLAVMRQDVYDLGDNQFMSLQGVNSDTIKWPDGVPVAFMADIGGACENAKKGMGTMADYIQDIATKTGTELLDQATVYAKNTDNTNKVIPDVETLYTKLRKDFTDLTGQKAAPVTLKPTAQTTAYQVGGGVTKTLTP